ncbi:Zygotic DNA replication licensing factor mcm3 [Portunus trituberculatus]|uniref:DNA replication licensing factor MCM3 n=1 Tax=Portunus trituberculatus TaxID=210409 RepID=A0A5B7DM28_PORTR|nr:Zygotic DNA replication licensing factor mcm3 [Portunus trituberculatus]
MGTTVDIERDARLREIQREYLEFLEDEEDAGVYTQLVRDMVTSGDCRIIVNINDLRQKNAHRASGLLNRAFEELPAFHRALKEFVNSVDVNFAKSKEELFVGFEGSFGSKHLSPRTLTSRNLGNLVCVEGIVTKCSLVQPKVVRSVHYCPNTKKTLERRYTDFTSYDPQPSSSIYPTKDAAGNPYETEFGLCEYKDHQTISIQEMPEKSPAGQLPRSVEVILDNDLVDKCKPGDRVQIVGIYRCLPRRQGSFTAGTFGTILLANNVILMSKEVSPLIYSDDVQKCKKFSKKKNVDVFELLAKSLAPSIHGHEYIKKALLCMLLGGVEKVLPNGTRLRGDINILLIGDPSVAKSQLLRYVMSTAPRAITTTGRGSSGVGLTAAVTTDNETGERRLQAGAMVLGDRGVVCIDEFDKMTDADRTGIHEVMEQGRVTIAKAGIHARLNARCSVLAAANPVYGRYDQYKTPMENIGLQDSLLSRFDCLFIMLDVADPDSDRRIADHVVRMHRYRSPREQDGEALPINPGPDMLSTNNPDVAQDEETDTPIYEKYNALLHGSLRSKNDKIVSIKFMRKYIHIAKNMKPTLTKEACEVIAEEYSRLRSQDVEHSNMARTQPITARALETLIRLSTAHAKARLSRLVEVEDAEAAIEMVSYAYFKKVMEKKKKAKKDEDSATETEDESEAEETEGRKRKRRSTGEKEKKPKKPKKKPGDEGYDPYEMEEDGEDEEMAEASLSTSRGSRQAAEDTTSTPKEISSQRLDAFKSSILKLLKEEHAQTMAMTRVTEYVNTAHPDQPFTSDEIDAAVERMTEANQIMVADGMLFLI